MYDLFSQPEDPKAGTQAALILADLRAGWRITPLQALRNYGCMRLAAVVFDLKKLGWAIATVMVKDPNGKRYAQYSMRGSDVKG